MFIIYLSYQKLGLLVFMCLQKTDEVNAIDPIKQKSLFFVNIMKLQILNSVFLFIM